MNLTYSESGVLTESEYAAVSEDARLNLEKGQVVFRNGFLAYHTSHSPDWGQDNSFVQSIKGSYKEIRLGDYVVMHDPGCRVHRVHHADRHIVTFGDIYSIGEDEVEDILSGVVAGDIFGNIAESNLSGRFACLIIRDGELISFQDPCGSRSIYYLRDGSRAIASHALLLSLPFGKRLDEATIHQMSKPHYNKRITTCLPGHCTPFQDIYRIAPNHAYDSAIGNQRRFWPHAARKPYSVSQFHEELDKTLHYCAGYVSRNYTPLISITGGIDSRTVLCKFHEMSLDFETMTWKNLNFDQSEREAVEAQKRFFGRKHADLYLKGPSQADRDARLNAIASTGFLQGRSKQAMCLAQAIRKLKRTEGAPYCFVTGASAEIFRGFYMKASRDTARPVENREMLSCFGHGGQRFGKDLSHIEFIREKFREFSSDTQFSPEFYQGFDSYDLFYWEHRVGMWVSTMMDSYDVVAPSLIGFNNRRLYEIGLGLDLDHRLGKDILATYIREKSPVLGEIEVI